MLYDTLYGAISKYADLGEQDLEWLNTSFKATRYNKRSILLHEGNTAHHLYFVLTGALHLYSIGKDGRWQSCNFALPGSFLTNFESFSEQAPSAYFIEALEDGICLSISCKDCMLLMKKSPAFNTFIYSLLENLAKDNIKRTAELLALSPEERYSNLLAVRKDLFKIVPQRFLASYIGIAPESLSRIKKRQAQSVNLKS